MATDRVDAARQVVESMREAGGEGSFLCHDVTSQSDWQAVLAAIDDVRGRLDVLVNNAGIVLDRALLETSLDEWRRVLAVNLDGVFLGTRFGIEAMARGGGGSIINLSSVYGLVGGVGLSAYSASKGGVRSLTKCAALECAKAKNGIRVNSVHPGYIETPMVTDAIARSPSPEAARRFIERQHALERMGEAEDVALAILYLASDESRFVTGTELVVDGGMTAR
jgi:NAD(P)-dependent dehydrogenase (short-subunit alcohol dehydrogenase family)